MRAVVLARAPGPRLRPDDFATSDAPPPRSLRPGEVRLRVRWLSIDPYQRGLLDESPMFGQRIRPGTVMAGRGIGEVIESRADGWAPGEHALGDTGWADEAVADAARLVRVAGPAEQLPLHLGVLGVSGLTALLGLEALGGIDDGDVLLVSSAAGAVGSTVVQIARARGARVVALASGEHKTALLRELGAAAVIDRLRSPDLPDALRAAAPEGLTAFFDNVGESTLLAGLMALRPRGRALLCGYVAGYEAAAGSTSLEVFRLIMRQRLELRGFLVHDHAARFSAARAELSALIDNGRVQPLQTVVEGLVNAPAALCDLLAGRAIGKVVVKLVG